MHNVSAMKFYEDHSQEISSRSEVYLETSKQEDSTVDLSVKSAGCSLILGTETG